MRYRGDPGLRPSGSDTGVKVGASARGKNVPECAMVALGNVPECAVEERPSGPLARRKVPEPAGMCRNVP